MSWNVTLVTSHVRKIVKGFRLKRKCLYNIYGPNLWTF